MEKLTICKTCGAQIAKSAKACPNCGAKNRRRHPVLAGILAVVIILLIIGIVAGSKDQTPTKVVSATPTPTASPAPVFTVGDTAEMNKVRVTLVAVRSSKGTQFYVPDEGKVFLIFEVEIENGTDSEIGVSSLLCFTAYADDYSLAFSLSGIMADGGKQMDGTIAAGKKMRGVVSFEAPEGWKTAEIHFKPNVWAGREFVFQATA